VNKRILFIDHDPYRSGSTVSLEHLVKAFSEHGYDVIIHTPKKDSSRLSAILPSIEIRRFTKWHISSLALSTLFLNTEFPLSWRGMQTNLKDLVKLCLGILVYRKVIRETRADLVYVNEHAVIQASIAAWICGIPAVIHVRSQLLRGVFGIRRGIVTRLILRLNQWIFAITDKEALQFNARGREADKIKIVGEFFNEADFRSVEHKFSGRKPEQHGTRSMVMMLGGIQRIKGTVDFLRAAQRVITTRNDVVFVIAGTIRRNGSRVERKHYEECSRIIEEMEPGKQILVLGEIENAMEWVASIDILVSASSASHFSRPVIEAWGCGKPVIATATEHMDSLIVNGVNGLLVDVGDSAGLARSIEILLDSATLRNSYGKAGKEKVRAEFDASVNTKLIIDYCDRVVKPLSSSD
jgi:glycosyltransferase involved in cell wall biosynthesis